MNGNWFVWGNATNANTAREYVAAWRHVHNIFTRVGATNATWVWCPNNGNAKGSIANLASFYPGNAYVNWTCTDVYSYGKHSGRSAGSWNALAGPTYQAISRLAPHKPMMVGEFNAASAGGSQPSWLSSVLAEIPNAYPKIHAVILFDTFRQWELEDHPASVTAFAKGIRRAVYAPNHFAGLTGGPIKAL
jgi:beta-mannanase